MNAAQKKWKVEPGQLWRLGQHRVLCGDSTRREQVARLMGAEQAKAVVTDPPYAILGAGISVAGKGIEAAFDRQFYRVWFSALLTALDDFLAPGAAQWLTIDWRGATAIEEAVVGTRWRLAGLGVWHRGGLGMGYALRKCHEHFVFLVAKGWRRAATDVPDVWACSWGPNHRRFGHPAEKPVELMKRAIELCAKNGAVLDPFVGSGTTLMACESLQRPCRAIDIEPQYVAMTIERWAAATGEVPQLAA